MYLPGNLCRILVFTGALAGVAFQAQAVPVTAIFTNLTGGPLGYNFQFDNGYGTPQSRANGLWPDSPLLFNGKPVPEEEGCEDWSFRLEDGASIKVSTNKEKIASGQTRSVRLNIMSFNVGTLEGWVETHLDISFRSPAGEPAGPLSCELKPSDTVHIRVTDRPPAFAFSHVQREEGAQGDASIQLCRTDASLASSSTSSSSSSSSAPPAPAKEVLAATAAGATPLASISGLHPLPSAEEKAPENPYAGMLKPSEEKNEASVRDVN